MKCPLLLLLALPLPAAAQVNFSNAGPAAQQAAAQQTRLSAEFERDAFDKQQRLRRLAPQPPEGLQPPAAMPWEQAQAQQAQRLAQQRAAEQLARAGLSAYAHDLDSTRRAHPAATAQLAAAWKQEDAQRLAWLTVRTYRDVLLPGQVLYASAARSFAGEGQQQWQRLTADLLDNAWWNQQDPALVSAKITAYRSALTTLLAELLGFDPATAPKAARMPSTAPLDAQRAAGVFDSAVATRYLRETARVEKVNYSQGLVRAFNAFNRQVAEVAVRPKAQQHPQALRKAVKAGLREVDDALGRYELLITHSELLDNAQAVVYKHATVYLSKSGPASLTPADSD